MCLIIAFYDTVVNSCSICCKAAVSPCLKPLPATPIRGQLRHCRVAPPSSACRAVRDTPNEVREPIQLEEVESFQDGRSSGRGAEELRPLWWQVASQFIIKPSYPVQALRRSNTPIHLNPSSSSFGYHSPSPGVYSSVQNCVSKGAGI